MKIFTLLIVSGLSLCTIPVLNAQESKSPWSFGVKAGINFSDFSTDRGGSSSGDNNGKIGFNGGVTVEYALRNGFFLSSAMEFTTKGTDKTESGSFYFPDGRYFYGGLTSDSRRMKYLQIPFTIGYRIPVSRKVNLAINAGGYFAFGLSGKGTMQSWGLKTEPHKGEVVTYIYNVEKSTKNGDTDFGLLGGVGVEYMKFSLNYNYEFGLRDLYTASPSLTYANSKNMAWKNRNVVISVGYKF